MTATTAPEQAAQPLLGEELISAGTLQRRIASLADQIRDDYAGADLLLVGVLKGAVTFLVDLARELAMPLEVDFMAVSSYGPDAQSSGIVRILKDLDSSIEGRHVLVVEDIVDTGATLHYLVETLQAHAPATLRVCTLLNRRTQRKAEVVLDYVGFEISEVFVVGFGLDHDEQYRNLPNILRLHDSHHLDDERPQMR